MCASTPACAATPPSRTLRRPCLQAQFSLPPAHPRSVRRSGGASPTTCWTCCTLSRTFLPATFSRRRGRRQRTSWGWVGAVKGSLLQMPCCAALLGQARVCSKACALGRSCGADGSAALACSPDPPCFPPRAARGAPPSLLPVARFNLRWLPPSHPNPTVRPAPGEARQGSHRGWRHRVLPALVHPREALHTAGHPRQRGGGAGAAGAGGCSEGESPHALHLQLVCISATQLLTHTTPLQQPPYHAGVRGSGSSRRRRPSVP